MNGDEFYQYLSQSYKSDGQCINGSKQFVKWLKKNDGNFNFQFKFPAKTSGKWNIKSIPKRWLVEAKNAKENAELINRQWFNNFFSQDNFNDCRASMAIWLLDNA